MKTKKKTGDKYKNKVMTADGEKIRKEIWLKEDDLKAISHLAVDSEGINTSKEYIEDLIATHLKSRKE